MLPFAERELVRGGEALTKQVITKVIMDSGEEFTLYYNPSEVIKRFTQEDGKIRDEFIEMGVLYINPKHVSMLCYEEVEED
jgi:hypothetical protein